MLMLLLNAIGNFFRNLNNGAVLGDNNYIGYSFRLDHLNFCCGIKLVRQLQKGFMLHCGMFHHTTKGKRTAVINFTGYFVGTNTMRQPIFIESLHYSIKTTSKKGGLLKPVSPKRAPD